MYQPNKVIPKGPWKKTYAYLPVKTISGKWVWLQSIRKRPVIVNGPMTNEPDFQYATTVELMVKLMSGEIE